MFTRYKECRRKRNVFGEECTHAVERKGEEKVNKIGLFPVSFFVLSFVKAISGILRPSKLLLLKLVALDGVSL